MTESTTTENAFWAREVAENLKIGGSTLRKWCLALENEGYLFIKGQNNSRAFTEKDIINLRQMKRLVHEQRITLEEAAKVIVSNVNNQPRTPGAREEQAQQELDTSKYATEEQVNEIIERLEKQEKFNKALLEQLEKQQKYIEESLNKRDQQLLESLRESQETKKLIAAATETIEKQQEKENWFKSIFKRKKNSN